MQSSIVENPSINFRGAEFVLVIGSSGLQYVKPFFDRGECGNILVYEPQDQTSYQSLHEKIHVITGQDSNELRAQICKYFSEDLSRLSAVQNTDIIWEQPQETNEKRRTLLESFVTYFHEEAEQFELLRVGTDEDSFRGLMNTLENFSSYFSLPSIYDLKNIFSGKVGVMVGSGPSLKFHLSYLKQNQNKVVIFCCDSALKVLLEAGVIPDFVTTTERMGDSRYLFEGMPELPSTFLLGPVVTDPLTFDAYKGPKIHLERDAGFENWVIEQKNALNIGISPSHLGYVGLKILGCNPVYLLGQDCACDPQTQETYNQGVSNHIVSFLNSIKHDKEMAYGEVIGHDGKIKMSIAYWREVAKLFASIISSHPGDVFNAIPIDYGVPVARTKRIDPDEVMRGFSLLEEFDKKNKILSVLNSRMSSRDILSEASVKLNNIKAGMQDLQKFSLQVMRDISKIYLRYSISPPHTQIYQTFFSQLEKHHAEILSFREGFFDKHLYPLMSVAHTQTGIGISRLNHTSLDYAKSMTAKLNLIFEWYRNIHFWTSRSIELLDWYNEERWHYWS